MKKSSERHVLSHHRRERNVRPRTDIFEEYKGDDEVRAQFRFTEDNIRRIAEVIDLRERDPRGRPLSSVQRLCLFLTYVGGKDLLKTAGRLLGVKKSTACGIVAEVAEALVARSRDFI